ncbi:hypothetical protein ACTQW9_10280, partial [Lachnospiraceae bacterium LCP19S3_B12]
EADIPIAPSLYSLSNKMDNSLLAVRDITHKYIVVERKRDGNQNKTKGARYWRQLFSGARLSV